MFRRWEAMREGIQAYTYLKILRARILAKPNDPNKAAAESFPNSQPAAVISLIGQSHNAWSPASDNYSKVDDNCSQAITHIDLLNP